MEFGIEELEYALERYTNVVGVIEDKSDRINTNKRQAFINAFADGTSIHNLRELFKMKDANNVRYAMRQHEDKYYTYLDYCDSFKCAEAIKHRMVSGKLSQKNYSYERLLEEA